jgi:hypothetical protein
MTRSSFPSPEEGLRLHERLCRPNDPVAVSDFLNVFLMPLVAHLRQCCRDEHLCVEAAERAVLDYLSSPERYCPEKLDLDRYLCLIARRDLFNLQRRDRRHHDGHVSIFSVEFGPDAGNLSGREKGPLDQLCRNEEVAMSEEFFHALEAGLSDQERRILALMREGRADTAACAAVLGLGDAPPEEQERQAKRVKDRIKKRIERRESA